MAQQEFEIRALTERADIDAYLRIAVQAFSPDKDQEKELASWRQGLLNSPLMHGECIRGIFDLKTSQIIGGYIFWHRHLCLESARLKTGCIGAVAVAPEQRKRGGASALMEDAIACAKPQELALLFLTGIPNFYHHFGYAPVIETTDIYIERKDIQNLASVETIQVREATVEDTPALLALYQEHYQSFIGSLERPLAEQRYILSQPDSNDRYLLAIDPDQQIVGYLLIHQTDHEVSQTEVAATTWSAISALLQEHERRVAACQTPAATDETKDSIAKPKSTIRWAVPEDTLLFYHLANHIPFRSERLHHYNADWMARIGDLKLLVENLLPLWEKRLSAAQITWPAALELKIDQQTFVLTQDATGIHSTESTAKTAPDQRVHLTSQAFIQLCFGYRPISWFAAQPQQTIPSELCPLLEALFPPIPSWVPGSDFF